jgi:cobalt-zinc-cadmium efflux system protein
MFAIATALNLGLVAIRVFYDVIAHSVALLADAGHNFGDALGLVIAWGAHLLARLNPTARFTYGFRQAISSECSSDILQAYNQRGV